jgi:hypothetical protein
VSIFEMEPLDSTLSARISGVDATQAAALWQGGGGRLPPGKVDPIRSRPRCRAPSPRPAWRSTGPMARAAPPACRRRTPGPLAGPRTRCTGGQIIGRVGWPPIPHNRACIPPERGWRCTADRACACSARKP